MYYLATHILAFLGLCMHQDQGSATLTDKTAISPPFLAIKICVEPQNIFEPHNEGTQLKKLN